MKTDNFDALLTGIRHQTPDASAVEQAAGRVRSRLFTNVAPEAASSAGVSLRTCADFQALMPEYLNRTLAPAKALLLVDHTHACVACRGALERARSGNVRVLPRPQPISSRVSPTTRWAVAAMFAVATGLGTWAMVRSMMIPPGARATVQAVNGILYQVADRSSTPVFAGHEMSERQIVRTAKDSTAMLRLADGSMVEMNERSEVAITRSPRGATILLDRGNVIVHAAKQRNGALYVKTADCEVAVKGTIFAVTSGTKGSRVSVVEGSVKVDHAGASQMLKPGEQANTEASVSPVPVRDDIAWSRDAAKYLAMLGELSGLQKDIEKIPAPAVRTASRLLDLIPANTVVYAAIPNIGSTLTQANQLFQDRMQSSPVLKQWWESQGNHGAQLQDMVQKIRTVSDYLGDEVVLAFTADAFGKGMPIIMAETRRPGLREYLQGELASLNAHSGAPAVELLDGPANLRSSQPAGRQTTKVYLANDMVAITPDGDLVRELARHIESPETRGAGMQERIRQAYQSGATWLFCADLSRMNQASGNAADRRAVLDASGLSGARYLLFERKQVNGETRNQATLAFSGARQGLASWLAAPGPMSTLDFVSPDASLAASFVVNNPGALLSQLLTQAEAANANLRQEIDTFQSRTGVNLIHDLADPLGGELTFAIDGPLVPVPSWKLAVEVYSPDRLEWAFEQLVSAFNQQTTGPTKLAITKSQAGARTYYALRPVGGNAPAGLEADYVFVDGYLLAAANRALLDTAIQNRSTGYTLTRSEKFRAILPKDANSNFSGIVYHNVGAAVAPLADRLKNMNQLSPEQQQAVNTLKANSGPGLIYAYGEPDRITIAANGSLFGFSLDSFALPQVMAGLMHPTRAK